MISWADVQNIAPEMADVPAASQAAILAQVYAELEPSQWGARLHLAAKWLAAHIGALWLRGNSGGTAGAVIAGPVTSQTVGPVSQTFAQGGSSSSSSSSSYESTSYGQQFERLRRSILLPRMGFVV